MSFYHQLPWCDLTTVTGLRQDTRVRSANTQSSAEASLYIWSTYKGAAPRPCPRPHAHARTDITSLLAPQCVPQPRQHLICGGKARRGGCRASCRIETSAEGRQGKRKGEDDRAKEAERSAPSQRSRYRRRDVRAEATPHSFSWCRCARSDPRSSMGYHPGGALSRRNPFACHM